MLTKYEEMLCYAFAPLCPSLRAFVDNGGFPLNMMHRFELEKEIRHLRKKNDGPSVQKIQELVIESIMERKVLS